LTFFRGADGAFESKGPGAIRGLILILRIRVRIVRTVAWSSALPNPSAEQPSYRVLRDDELKLARRGFMSMATADERGRELHGSRPLFGWFK
jgi:hypothetical protein